MSNWKQMMVSKARHGGFKGNGLADENAYYAFFADSSPRWIDCHGIELAVHVIATAAARVMKVTFPASVPKLFR